MFCNELPFWEPEDSPFVFFTFVISGLCVYCFELARIRGWLLMALASRIECSNATPIYVIQSTSFVLSGGKSQRFSLQHDPFPIKSLQSKNAAKLWLV
jgi:hypothetical protein